MRPMHVHHHGDEAFHVLDDELQLRVGDKAAENPRRRNRLAPRGVAHTYRVTSPQGARWLIITPGANFERFVRAMSRPAQTPETPEAAGPPTTQQVAALAEVAREHGIDIVGPPLSA